ncbi:twin-arginine translocase TatA/TatE family subunit [Yersinia kristensenii]|uniref:Sec-independent protein translocase protein TatA n=1 Tax=Yersinia kristensenii TaxID=28152 RepID=A0A0T9M149_YERKR|nr:Sec-independent protein translocase subunit TatA [Yersinia kristensenii]PJG61417.1 twin-arginine translocase TatA/TatE family subunit [Yersinia kristensenii]CNF46308.1 Sec-independent protein translocase protein TatA [Yersinia kristensenii]
MGGIGWAQLLIIAVIVVLLFGTNKLRTLGADLGASIKGFKKAMGDDAQTPPTNVDKTSNDADFAKTITEKQQPAAKAEESKSHDKEQG